MKSLRSSFPALFFLMLLGCHDGEIIGVNPDVERARKWFEQNRADLSGLDRHSATGRHFSDVQKVPNWNETKIHRNSNGIKIVEVALDYEEYLIYSASEIESARPNASNSMLLFEVRPGEYEVYVLKIYEDPDSDLDEVDFNNLNFEKIPTTFSGSMWVFDWNENLIGGWKIVDGKKTKFYARMRGNQYEGGRVSETSVRCYQIDTYWYQIVCIGSLCSDPVLIDHTTVIECETIIAPPDPHNPGGGGGGGDEGECMEPHPYIEGLMVPCEEEEWIIDDDIQSQNRLCGGYIFTTTGEGLTAEILNVGARAENKGTLQILHAYWGSMCVTFGSSSLATNSATASTIFNQAWNTTMTQAQTWLNTQQSPTTIALSQFILQTFRANLSTAAGGYSALSTGPCSGAIASTVAEYCN